MNATSPTNLRSSPLNFRRAGLADLEQVCELLVNLNGKLACAYPSLPMSGRDIALSAAHVVEHGICLIGNGAVCGATLVPWLFNRQFVIGTIVFWNFVRPSGIHILEAMCVELKEHGATHVNVSSHPPDDKAARIYKRLNFIGAENQWILKL